MTRKPVPIACTLDGNAMPGRLDDWRALLGHVVSRTKTADDGLRLEFHADTPTAELMRLVTAEQQCCPFFEFAITVDHRGLALEVRAPADAGAIVAALFGTTA
jgi:hypothetical protein